MGSTSLWNVVVGGGGGSVPVGTSTVALSDEHATRSAAAMGPIAQPGTRVPQPIVTIMVAPRAGPVPRPQTRETPDTAPAASRASRADRDAPFTFPFRPLSPSRPSPT